MNKNFILPFVLPISLTSMQIKPNILNTNKLFKYNGEMYTGEEIRKLLNE